MSLSGAIGIIVTAPKFYDVPGPFSGHIPSPFMPNLLIPGTSFGEEGGSDNSLTVGNVLCLVSGTLTSAPYQHSPEGVITIPILGEASKGLQL